MIGGRHATEMPEDWLLDCPNIDILVRGDGEEVIAQIAQGRPLETIPAISYRRNGGVVHTANPDPGPIRDDIRPDRSLRRKRYEVDVEGIGIGISFDAIMSSRGCPFNCRFCSFSVNPWGNKRQYSARSPESVVDELAGMDADWVVFVDDVFTYDMDRVEAICDLIIKRGITKHYVVNSRIEAAGRVDVLRKMERAGFAVLLLGVESAHDKTLRSHEQGVRRCHARETLCDPAREPHDAPRLFHPGLRRRERTGYARDCPLRTAPWGRHDRPVSAADRAVRRSTRAYRR